MQQLMLFPNVVRASKRANGLVHDSFSHGGICTDHARAAPEECYGDLFQETTRFNRQLVSFQANKTETPHRWLKYRESFSASLVEMLMDEFRVKAGDTVLNPFAGSYTTLLVAKMQGVNAIGIELLPHCPLAWEAKSRAFDYDLDELHRIREMVERVTPPPVMTGFPHLSITQNAFPEQYENATMPARIYWDYQLVQNYVYPWALKGEEPYATKLKAAEDEMIPIFRPEDIHVVVVGGETNGYWRITGCNYRGTVSVDAWR